MTKKRLRAVAPYTHPGNLNFKRMPYEAWQEAGGPVAPAHYPTRALHGLVFRHELPAVWKSRREARLRFVEPVSLTFDTFPDYVTHEVVPMVWDCWPKYLDTVCRWIGRHDVRTAIFTSRQTADRVKAQCPGVDILWCPEAIDARTYTAGRPLREREIHLLEFGRRNDRIFSCDLLDRITVGGRPMTHVCTNQNGKFIYNNAQLHEAMGNAMVVVTLPRSMTQPELAGDVETLTQRYWECMLSRMVMVGHAPQELVDLVGYNPVVELREDMSPEALVQSVIEHIDDYQPLVDRNRATALSTGTWPVRMRMVMAWLKDRYVL